MTSVQEDLEKDLKKMYYDSDEYKNLWKTFRAFKLALLGHLHVSLGAEEVEEKKQNKTWCSKLNKEAVEVVDCEEKKRSKGCKLVLRDGSEADCPWLCDKKNVLTFSSDRKVLHTRVLGMEAGKLKAIRSDIIDEGEAEEGSEKQ